MIFNIKSFNNKNLEKSFNNSMNELDKFFKLGWNTNKPNIILVEDRKTIDKLLQRKTQRWIVGWSRGNDIYLLNYKNYNKESSNIYSEKEYFKLLKHELAHCFSNIISNYASKPAWLLEDISIYLSDQNKSRKRPKELSNFIEFYECNYDANIYDESGFAVEFLVKNHGIDKIILLLKRLKEAKNKEESKILFREIYGFKLIYDNFR